MTSSQNFTLLEKPALLSEGVIYKIKFNELTLVYLDDSNCYYKFSGYPVEIWVGLQEGKVPKQIFEELTIRDSLPNEFIKDFNNFFIFLQEQSLISF